MTGLPNVVIEGSHRPGGLKYLTRGLTSNLYTYALPPGCSALSRHLACLRASHETIVIKTVDTEDEAKPHSVLKELAILQSLTADQTNDGQRYVSHLFPRVQTPAWPPH